MKRIIQRIWTQVTVWSVMVFFTIPAAAQQDPGAGKPVPGGIGFQVATTPQSEMIHDLHNLLLIVITAITIFVTALLLWVMFRYNRRANPEPSQFSHNTLIEIIWTAVPVLILIVIAIPSFRTLVYLEEVPEDIDFTIKATGQNWYWDYEYPDHGEFLFSSNMLTKEEGEQRGVDYRLAVDEPIYIPVGATVRLQVTAGDRLHAWTIPSFGVKIDTVPGRLNETWFTAEKEGVYHGQCSELCGARHAFMPIEVRVVNQAEFDQWVSRMQREYGSLEQEPATQFAQLH